MRVTCAIYYKSLSYDTYGVHIVLGYYLADNALLLLPYGTSNCSIMHR